MGRLYSKINGMFKVLFTVSTNVIKEKSGAYLIRPCIEFRTLTYMEE